MTRTSLGIALLALSCSGGGVADAPLGDALSSDALSSDAPLDPKDGAVASADAANNPAQLWLAGINGSEINLELIESGPPHPF